jgi:type II secretory pathway component PulM
MTDQPVSAQNVAFQNAPEIAQVSQTAPLNATMTEAIKRCIDNGKLQVTLNRVDLAQDRSGQVWLYD